MAFLVDRPPAVPLAGWAGVDGVEPVERERERVGLVELEREAGLRLDIDADDVEPGAVVARGCATGTAEQVQEPGPHHAALSLGRAGGTSARSRTSGVV